MQRNGFTLIELVFVIVILGILAGVAIPRLSATRDDAVSVTAYADFNTVVKVIQTTAHATGIPGDLGAIISPSSSLAITAQSVTVSVKGQDCASGSIVGNTLVINIIFITNDCRPFSQLSSVIIPLAGQTLTL